MNVTLPIPDDIAARLGLPSDLSRRALEAFALAEYRDRRLTRSEVRRLLGFGTRGELDAFLKTHGVIEGPSVAEIEREQQDLDRIGL